MARNCYHVQKKVWSEWSKTAQAVFNRSYSFFIKNKETMFHPKAVAPNKVHYRTTAWNAAWIAANSVDNVVTELY